MRALKRQYNNDANVQIRSQGSLLPALRSEERVGENRGNEVGQCRQLKKKRKQKNFWPLSEETAMFTPFVLSLLDLIQFTVIIFSLFYIITDYVRGVVDSCKLGGNFFQSPRIEWTIESLTLGKA